MPKLILFDSEHNIILTSRNFFIDASDVNELNLSHKVIDYIFSVFNDIADKTSPKELAVNISQLKENVFYLTDYYTAIIPPGIIDDEFEVLNKKQNQKLNFYPFKKYMLQSDEATRALVNKARQLAFWSYDHQYCGRCSNKTKFIETEYAKECISCSYRVYPRITPCVLAAVINNDKILLGRARHFPAGVYSLLAGFVEVGESCEVAVQREVFEESGVLVNNIQYFGSQPWPFPHSMMLAYTADYVSGDIKVDYNELEDARWFTFDGLRTCPDLLPAKGSLSRMLLDYLIERSVNNSVNNF